MAETTAANLEPQPAQASGVQNLPARIREYVDDLKAEMRKVTWPTWPQVQATTAVVIVTVFAFAFYFAAVDIILGRGIRRLFEAFTK